MTVRLKKLVTACALALVLAPAAARAEFGTTNLQLLQGYSFKDNLLGYDTKSGTMTTVTLNHFSTWAYGDNFAFVDFYRGQYVDAFSRNLSGNTSMLYSEWHPRLFLNKLGAPTAGIFRNWGLAGEINQAQGFFAYMAGLGLDLAIPGFAVAGLNVYYRYDNFALHTWQVSPFWTVPFKIGGLDFLFTGFLDLTTNKDKKLDLMTQPELLVDVGALAGAPGRLHAGVEWYLHSYQDFVEPKRKTVSAPQVMIQWTAF